MNTLLRTECRQDGIFGLFTFDGEDHPFMVTLEHAWLQRDGTFAPIIPEGQYTCIRGIHDLHDGVQFTTFELTGVAGHSGLLFHAGNFNSDSEGCVLCGTEELTQANGENMITGSRAKFASWLAKLDGIDSFEVLVTNG